MAPASSHEQAGEEEPEMAASSARARLGFRDGVRGVHSSRTIMLAELGMLLDHARPEMTMADYRRLVVQENVLRKPTNTTREHTVRKLKTLYGLDSKRPVFRALFRLWLGDAESRPLLAMLCAQARDPRLRLASPVVLSAEHGAVMRPEDIIAGLSTSAPGRFSETNAKAIASRILSSFEQSGHLEGRSTKTRRTVVATPTSATYAFFLAYLEGSRAQRILTSSWASMLDVTPDALHDLALAASRRGLLTFRHIGNVVELRFPDFLSREEEELTRVQQD